MKNLFLTGEVGIGKSTILQNTLKEINISLGGYITQRLLEGDTTKFIVKSLYNNKEYEIINVNHKESSKVVLKKAFESDLVSILEKSLKDKDLIILDELGSAENDIELFTSKIFELLNSEKQVFGVIKDADCKFLNDIRNRDDVRIIRITEENRDHIFEELIEILKGHDRPYV